jgi:Domain of unknown function (DUF4055)
MPDVTTTRAEYDDALPLWQMAEDAAAGEHAVKAKREEYLPVPNPADKSVENSERYKQYLKRAVYYNATGRTLHGMLGLAFGRSPEVDLPDPLKYASDDITGTGVSLIQQAQAAVAQVMLTGRAGLLVDFPRIDTAIVDVSKTSKADEEAGNVRPTITYYPAKAIINWRTTRRQSKTVLEMVVLKECHEVVDGFSVKDEDQYRVVRLTATGVTAEIWRKKRNDGTSKDEWISMGVNPVLRGDGTAWQEIPFTFIGSKDNDISVDHAPMYDLAVLNIAHYRNSADYEDSAFFVGQPQYWVSGLDEEWRNWMQEKGIYVGARTILPLPAQGSAGILQAQPNTLVGEAMMKKEEQMAALGARLIMSGGTQKTARQQSSEDAVANSVLSLTCDNVSEAYLKALRWFSEFTTVGDAEIKFQIPTDFMTRDVDATELTTLLELVQAGKMPESDLWARLRNVGLIANEKTDDEIREEIEQQTPPGGDPFANPGAVDPVTGLPITPPAKGQPPPEDEA